MIQYGICKVCDNDPRGCAACLGQKRCVHCANIKQKIDKIDKNANLKVKVEGLIDKWSKQISYMNKYEIDNHILDLKNILK